MLLNCFELHIKRYMLIVIVFIVLLKIYVKQKRKISARIILFVYLTSLVSVTLFHYHGNNSVDNGYYADTTVRSVIKVRVKDTVMLMMINALFALSQMFNLMPFRIQFYT